MSVVNINKCKNLTAIVRYCITPKKEELKKRVADLYSDLGSAEEFLKYGNSVMKNTSRKIQGYTLLQSFSRMEFDIDNAEHICAVNELGKKLARGLYPNSPVLVITHNDSEGECLHNHIVVLNHDLVTGKAIAQNRRFCEVKSYNDELMNKYGLEICQHSNTPKTQGEYWSDKRNGWLGMLREGMDEALAKSTSLQEFQDKLLVEGISSNMQKKNGELKEHFSFAIIDSDGKTHKKRSESLGEEYTKEEILRRLANNAKEAQLQRIIPMSEWIQEQNEKKVVGNALDNPNIKNKEDVATNTSMDSVTMNEAILHIPIIEIPKESANENSRKEIEFTMKKDIDKLHKKEQEHQELLKRLAQINHRIKELEKLFDRDEDTEEDWGELERQKSEKLNLEIKEHRFKREPLKESLNESLLPSNEIVNEKDRSMSF